MKAVILAGGFGTRLKEVVYDVPKPMALVAGKPFLEHQIRFLRDNGITDIILAVYYMSDKIKSYFGDGTKFKVNITYSEEEIPLGTAGAVKKAQKYIDDTFLVLNGDSYSQINLAEFLEFHKSKKSNFTISLVKSKDSLNYGTTLLDGSKITAFCEKNQPCETNGEFFINSGIYIFEPKIFDYIEPDKNVSFEKEIFPRLSKEGLLYGFTYEGYFMDIGRPETYEHFRKNILESIIMKSEDSVRKAMENITETGIDLIFVVDEQRKILGVINDRIIKEFMLRGGGIENKISDAMIKDLDKIYKIGEDESKIKEFFSAGTRHVPVVDELGRLVDVRFRAEEIKSESFPIIRGKSPLRISFAGGGTDLPYFFEKYGGVVINATIDKYCHATLIKRADKKIIINSDLGDELILNSKNELIYDGKFDLIKSIIKIMNPDFGFEIYLHNDVPPGRGLGSSASLAVLIVSLISYMCGVKYDDKKIAEIAYKAERDELNIKGGWQDQYAALTGGFNFMEFDKDKTLIYPLRIKEEMINELNNHLLLCYIGKSHTSGDVHKSQEISFKQNEIVLAAHLNDLKKIAVEIKDALLTNNLEKIGNLLNESWENKKKLDSNISNPLIDSLYEVGIKNGAYGGKLLGAGTGGYILFFISPKRRNQVTAALQRANGEIMNFNFDFKGTHVWSAKSKI